VTGHAVAANAAEPVTEYFGPVNPGKGCRSIQAIQVIQANLNQAWWSLDPGNPGNPGNPGESEPDQLPTGTRPVSNWARAPTRRSLLAVLVGVRRARADRALMLAVLVGVRRARADRALMLAVLVGVRRARADRALMLAVLVGVRRARADRALHAGRAGRRAACSRGPGASLLAVLVGVRRARAWPSVLVGVRRNALC
jgi:hypothetical protein